MYDIVGILQWQYAAKSWKCSSLWQRWHVDATGPSTLYSRRRTYIEDSSLGVFGSDKQLSFSPGILKLQRTEVLLQSVLLVGNDGYQAEVGTVFRREGGGLHAAALHGLVELLHHQAHYVIT